MDHLNIIWFIRFEGASSLLQDIVSSEDLFFLYLMPISDHL